jgi:gas vesicle protein
MKLQDLRDMDKDDFLGLLGLQTKRSFTGELLGTLGTFGIGLLVGAGVALLLAPKPGRDLRNDLRAKIRCGKCESEEKIPDGAAASSSSS